MITNYTNIADVAYQAEVCEADGGFAIFSAAPEDVRLKYGVEAQKVGSATLLKCAWARDGSLNDVLALGIAAAATERTLDDIMVAYKEAGTRFTVRLSPLARPTPVAEWLETRGLVLTDRKPKMYRSTDAPPRLSTA